MSKSNDLKPVPDNKLNLPKGYSAREIAMLTDPAEQLRLLQTRKALKEALDEDAKADEAARAHEIRLREIEQQIEEKAAAQEQCSHFKQNGVAAIVGQRASHGKPIYLCQNCQKIWLDTPIPHHLAITMDSERIGGPA